MIKDKSQFHKNKPFISTIIKIQQPKSHRKNYKHSNFNFSMGNQSFKKHQTQVQPINQNVLQLKEITPKEENFVLEIQNENQRNVNHRKSINIVPNQNLPRPPSTHVPQRISKREASKKELPPLKLKSANSLKTTPLGNVQNTTNQTANMVDELEQVRCQKGTTQVSANYLQVGFNQQLEDKDLECQKQNNEAALNVRARKFRPSHSSMKKSLIPPNVCMNDGNQKQQIPEVAVL